MPFRSESQRRKFALLVEQGKISQGAFEEWSEATGDAKLPERVSAKVKKPRTLLRRRHR